MRDESAFLLDMLDSALRVQRQIAGKTHEQFLADEILQDAVLWRLAIIGEAAKGISAQTRSSLPDLPFDDMARMRDFIAHVYWRIDYRIVWDTASNDLPVLINHLKARLGSRPGGGGAGP